MQNRECAARSSERRGQVQGAADVGGHDDVGPALGHRRGLGGGKGVSAPGLSQKVVAGRPAADSVPRQFDDAGPRDAGEEFVHEAPTPQGVAQRAGFVHGYRLPPGCKHEPVEIGFFDEVAVNVEYLREPVEAGRVVVFQFRGAAGGDGYERRGFTLEGAEIAEALTTGQVGESGMARECGATALVARDMDALPCRLQDTDGRI